MANRFLLSVLLLMVFYIYDADGPVIASPTTPSKIWNVPPHHIYHLQREDYIEKIKNRLEEKESRAKLVTLVGMAGMGKTQLAKEYAHTYADNYDVIWWIDANQDLLPQIRELGNKLYAFKNYPMPNINEKTPKKWLNAVKIAVNIMVLRFFLLLTTLKTNQPSKQ